MRKIRHKKVSAICPGTSQAVWTQAHAVNLKGPYFSTVPLIRSATSGACQGLGFPGVSEDNATQCNAGDAGLIPESGRSPGGGNGYSLQNSCQEQSVDREG